MSERGRKNGRVYLCLPTSFSRRLIPSGYVIYSSSRQRSATWHIASLYGTVPSGFSAEPELSGALLSSRGSSPPSFFSFFLILRSASPLSPPAHSLPALANLGPTFFYPIADIQILFTRGNGDDGISIFKLDVAPAVPSRALHYIFPFIVGDCGTDAEATTTRGDFEGVAMKSHIPNELFLF